MYIISGGNHLNFHLKSPTIGHFLKWEHCEIPFSLSHNFQFNGKLSSGASQPFLIPYSLSSARTIQWTMLSGSARVCLLHVHVFANHTHTHTRTHVFYQKPLTTFEIKIYLNSRHRRTKHMKQNWNNHAHEPHTDWMHWQEGKCKLNKLWKRVWFQNIINKQTNKRC